MARHWVFRVDGNPYVAAEIQAGQLRQGWGMPYMSLTQDRYVLQRADWEKNYQKACNLYWNGARASDDPRRYDILYRMTIMDPGDPIIIPRMPRHDAFIVAKVGKRYSLNSAAAAERNGIEDFRHVIGLAPNWTVYDWGGPEYRTVEWAFVAPHLDAVNMISKDYEDLKRAIDGLSRYD